MLLIGNLESAFVERLKFFNCHGKIIQMYAMTEMVGKLHFHNSYFHYFY